MDFLLACAAYGLLYNSIGWRGLVMPGILPALARLFVRGHVKEAEVVWVQNRQLQRQHRKKVRAPLFSIFPPPPMGRGP